jgi:hypothetical protein
MEERIHVYPLHDHRLHVTEGDGLCWCNPVTRAVLDERGYVVGFIITHTAADGRPTQDRPFLHGAN